MDVISHALYGATLFSRSGLAGGRAGVPRRQPDWTVWAAIAFGLLPDLLSLGLHFLRIVSQSRTADFGDLSPGVLLLYRLTHSFVVVAEPVGPWPSLPG